MRRLILFAACCALLGACSGGSSDPAAPTPPAPAPACQTQNFGALKLGNTSAHTTQDVYVNNADEGTIAPGQFVQVSVAAGSQVTVVWKVTNTTLIACQPIQVTPIQCNVLAYNCAYP